MNFDIDKEYRIRALLKNIYAPVRTTHNVRQRVLNQLLETDLNAGTTIFKFDSITRICIPAIAITAIAFIVYGYLAVPGIN